MVNQHIADSFPMEWWSTRFAQAVGHVAEPFSSVAERGDVGSTILVSLPWEDPIPLKRVWVIWEIFCTNQMGARFDIAMPGPLLLSVTYWACEGPRTRWTTSGEPLDFVFAFISLVC